MVAMLLTIGTYLAFQYFGQKQTDNYRVQVTDVARGQAYHVPTQAELQAPLNKEIDFADKKVSRGEGLTSVETELYSAQFSNYGGTLSDLRFKKRLGREHKPLRTVHHKDFFAREESCFLLALEDATPFFYDLVEQSASKLVYSTKSDGWEIRKTYSIAPSTYEITLRLDFIPSGSAKPIRPRLFYPAPMVPEVGYDVLNAVSYNGEKERIEALAADSALSDAWKMPEVLGGENRYFLHTLRSDDDHFTQRGYYKKIGAHGLTTILEGPLLSQKSSYKLSLYFGPKDIEDMNAVDERLEGVLSFGWFSLLCKLLLRLLGWLYSYCHNWGFAIILLTLVIRLPFLPISIRGAHAMEQHGRLRPKVERINQQYRGDVAQRNLALVQLYREHNLSPAGQIVGCLPFLIDIPIMMALWRVLSSYMDLYQAPFVLWIVDLSSKDPFYVLPILMGLSILWTQRFTPGVSEKQKAIMIFMPLIMTALFANFAAGLVLYWLTKNILSIGEHYLRKRILPA